MNKKLIAKELMKIARDLIADDKWWQKEKYDDMSGRGTVKNPNFVVKAGGLLMGGFSLNNGWDEVFDAVLHSNHVSISEIDQWCKRNSNMKVEIATVKNNTVAMTKTIGELYEMIEVPKQKAVDKMDYHFGDDLAKYIGNFSIGHWYKKYNEGFNFNSKDYTQETGDREVDYEYSVWIQLSAGFTGINDYTVKVFCKSGFISNATIGEYTGDWSFTGVLADDAPKFKSLIPDILRKADGIIQQDMRKKGIK